MRGSAARRFGLATVCAILISNACGEGTEPGPPVPARVVVTSPIDTLLATGTTVLLNAVAYDAAGNALSVSGFTWQSSAPTVAAVVGNGEVSALAAGAATITATVDTRSGSLRVRVLDADPAAITALVADPLFVALVAQLDSGTRTTINDALTAFTDALTEGNLVLALSQLETMQNTLSTVTGADEVVPAQVLLLLLDHAEALFSL